MACNNSNNAGVIDNNNSNKSTKTHSDSLMDEVMEGHNIGMAKMSKLNERKKEIRHVLDSISKLPINIQKSFTQYKMQLDSTFNRLTFADYAMEKWMEEFNMDSAANNEEKRAEYLESEKIKISKVNEAMINSLQKADSLLKKKL
jgi:SMC interacting uncharacterized protein involved in chromosome segregation